VSGGIHYMISSLSIPYVDFAHGERLTYLLFLAPILFWVWRGRKKRRADWSALGQVTRPPKNSGWNWLAAIACLFIALAQPRWGRIGRAAAPGHDVVLVVDVSRSMAAEDATPNRLGRAVEEAESLLIALGKEQGDRVAVVAFAGEGELRCPLTEHLGAGRETLRELRPGDVQPGGSDFGQALTAAIAAFDQEDRAEGRSIVVFSDGESHDESWRDVAKRLEAIKIVVHGVAVGDSSRGHEIPVGPEGRPLKHNHEVVLSRRSDASLQQICKVTGGSFIPLGLSKGDLGELYRTRIAPAERRKRREEPATDRAERYPIFVAAALVCGLFGSFSGSRRRSLLAVLLLVVVGASPPSRSAKDAVDRGNAAFRSGKPNEALAAFEEAIALQSAAAVPRYNAGAILFQMARYDEAAERYREARERADAGLRTKIDYALGNTALAQGAVVEAIRHYDQCLASQVSGLEYDLVRTDAQQNRLFAVRHRPPGSGASDSEPSDGRDNSRRRNDPGDQQSKSAQDSSKDSPEADGSPPEGQSPAGKAAANRSRRGGAETRRNGDTPEERLAAALDAVREAEGQKLPDRPAPEVTGDRKDW
jgi:Ca-activated chloride channel homolog